MTEEQLETFTYCCLKYANNSHFDEERNISQFFKGNLDKRSFTDVVMHNANLANSLHMGVCFTMTCWAYHLLYTIGVDSDYYIFETIEKGTGYPNFVLLFKYNDEYKICDLAAQTQKIEKIRDKLFQMARDTNNSHEDISKCISELAVPDMIVQEPESYFENYGSYGIVMLSKGIDDERIFNEIPTISFQKLKTSSDQNRKNPR